MNLADLYKDISRFEQQLDSVLIQLELRGHCKNLHADHICVRLNDDTAVLSLKTELEEVSELISEAVVGGRTIYIFQLYEPIVVGPWTVSAIELPYPKPGQSYADGWEHIEFCIPEIPNTMEALSERFRVLFPHLTNEYMFDLYKRKDSMPEAEGEQIPNPTIGLISGGVGIKFHPRSIQTVVGYEAGVV